MFDAVGGYDEALPSSYAEDYEFLLRAVTVGDIGVINTPLASIRKYNASWFRERAEVVAESARVPAADAPGDQGVPSAGTPGCWDRSRSRAR